MGHNIVPYAYGISHTRMGQYTHMGQNSIKRASGMEIQQLVKPLVSNVQVTAWNSSAWIPVVSNVRVAAWNPSDCGETFCIKRPSSCMGLQRLLKLLVSNMQVAGISALKMFDMKRNNVAAIPYARVMSCEYGWWRRALSFEFRGLMHCRYFSSVLTLITKVCKVACLQYAELCFNTKEVLATKISFL